MDLFRVLRRKRLMGEQGSEPLEPVAWHTPQLLPWETRVQIRQLWLLERIYESVCEDKKEPLEWRGEGG